MRDFIPFKGHFKIQSISNTGEIKDLYEDCNMIMASARVSMAEIFANIDTPSLPFVNEIRLGTMGHQGATAVYDSGTILIPKTVDDGYIMERDRMFSESIDATVGTSLVLHENDVVNFTDATTPGYYQYTGVYDPNPIAVNQANIDSNWTFLGTVAPYTYEIGFTMSGDNNSPNATPITEPAGEVGGSVVTVVQNGSDVTFTVDVAEATAILQPGGDAIDPNGSSIFTEAALYADGDIFSLKTFKAKIKDNSVTLRIIWTISF